LFLLDKFRLLEKNDFRILSITELRMKNHQYVPVEEILRSSRLRSDEVTYRIKKLCKGCILSRSSTDFLGYEGYALTIFGYDALALRALVRSGAVEAIGKSLGVGKESDIYEALDSKRRRCAVKFHRLGRTSFRQTSRTRGYVADRYRVSWFYQSKLSAEKEYVSLKRLFSEGVSVPKPIAQNRHIVVMSLVAGTELKYAEIRETKPILKEILRNVRRAYLKAVLVHSDLSEYNILIKEDGKILIIDWPQSVGVNHPNSSDYLRKDLSNVIDCFRRKAGLRPDLERVLAYVKGDSGRLPIL